MPEKNRGKQKSLQDKSEAEKSWHSFSASLAVSEIRTTLCELWS
jgi:hypothetical protein